MGIQVSTCTTDQLTWHSRLSSLLLSSPQLVPPLPPPQLTEPPQHTRNPPTPTSPLCTSILTPSRMTTPSQTSTPMRSVMVTTLLEDTRLLSLTAGPRL